MRLFKQKRILLSLLIFQTIFVFFHQSNVKQIFYSVSIPKLEVPPKTILFYTPFFEWEDYGFGSGQQPFIDAKCPVNNCITTNNRSLLESISFFDAIVFHIRDMKQGEIALPAHRRPDQKYVMLINESPLHDEFPFESFQYYFNWTMTYRLDSDIYLPYGFVLPINSSATMNIRGEKFYFPRGNETLIKPIARDLFFSNLGKKFAAWMVTNSWSQPSRRDEFVAELKKYIEIDIYGPNRDLKCPAAADKECLQALSRAYKFYLSFENSICEDYVTEKFFKVLNLNIIPVVLGGADYSKIAPFKSYIDVKDFSSIKLLADYLKYLDSNITAYDEYFEWKQYYMSVENDFNRSFCQLCQVLNDESYPVSSHFDIFIWWRTDGKCIERNQNQWPWIK